MSGTEAWHERRYQLYVRCAFAFALLVRLAYVLFAHPPGHFVFSDMQSYDSVAFELLGGAINPWHAFRPVGYSMLLASVYRLTDGSRTFVGVLQALMSAALVPYAAELARAAGAGRRTALWVALLVATSVPLIFYSGLLLTEIPTTFCLVWALRQAIALAGGLRPRLWPWASLGLALGLAGAMRPNLLPLAPLVLLYAAWAGPRGWFRQPGLARRRRMAALAAATLGCALV
ncbi:MAG TPA: glycosyltransferase family 39 protein, partial [Polyangiales bacterium]